MEAGAAQAQQELQTQAAVVAEQVKLAVMAAQELLL
jgi:hypothetical protein